MDSIRMGEGEKSIFIEGLRNLVNLHWSHVCLVGVCLYFYVYRKNEIKIENWTEKKSFNIYCPNIFLSLSLCFFVYLSLGMSPTLSRSLWPEPKLNGKKYLYIPTKHIIRLTRVINHKRKSVHRSEAKWLFEPKDWDLSTNRSLCPRTVTIAQAKWYITVMVAAS